MFREAVRRAKPGRAPGLDGVVVELMKSCDELCLLGYEIIKNVWMSEEMPEDLAVGWLCLIYKKGAKNDLSNYRPITVLNHLFKVLGGLLLDQVVKETAGFFAKAAAFHGGGIKGRGAVDCLVVIQEALRGARDVAAPIISVFSDVDKAYDTVRHAALLSAMAKADCSYKVLSLVALCFRLARAKVKVTDTFGEELSEAFSMEIGGTPSLSGCLCDPDGGSFPRGRGGKGNELR